MENNKQLSIYIKGFLFLFCLLLITPFLFSQNAKKVEGETLYSTPPTAGLITFLVASEFSKDSTLQLGLYDLSGKLQKSTEITLSENSKTVAWDTNKQGLKIATGVYVLEVLGDYYTIRHKLIVDCGCKE